MGKRECIIDCVKAINIQRNRARQLSKLANWLLTENGSPDEFAKVCWMARRARLRLVALQVKAWAGSHIKMTLMWGNAYGVIPDPVVRFLFKVLNLKGA